MPKARKGHSASSEMKLRLAALALFAMLALSSCAPRVHVRPPDPLNPIYTVAVLPMYNVTNDVGGADTVREIIYERLKLLHYRAIPLKEVDAVLMDRFGITLGSQLEDTSDMRDIGEALGADALVYGYLLNFEDQFTGVYNVRKVRAGFKLVDTSTGATIWARGLGIKTDMVSKEAGVAVLLLKEAQDESGDFEAFGAIKGLSEIRGIKDWQRMGFIAGGSVEESAVLFFGSKVIGRILGAHLAPEASLMVDRILVDFPSGPGELGR